MSNAVQQHATEAVKAVGGCGAVSPDGSRVCIKAPHGDLNHGWEKEWTAEQNYELAQIHPVAKLILAALHDLDAAVYAGATYDMGRMALDTADQCIQAVDALRAANAGEGTTDGK